MRNNTKIIYKKHKLRNIIFDKKTVSRQELMQISNLNYRSIIRYAEELKEQHLIREENKQIGRGHPCVLYHSNSDQIYFMGITLIMDELWFSAVDINSRPLFTHFLTLPKEITMERFLDVVTAEIKTLQFGLSGKALCGICLNESLYLQPAKRISMFRELVPSLRKRFSTQTELYDNDALILHRTSWSHGISGRIGAFIPGDKVRFAFLADNAISDSSDLYFRKFRHWKIDRENGLRCQCGKHGCVNCTLTYEGIINRYKARISSLDADHITPSAFFGNLAAQYNAGIVSAIEFHNEIGELMARALIRLKRELHLDHIFLCPPKKTFFESTAIAYQQLTGEHYHPLYFLRAERADSIMAPAKLMRDQVFEITSYSGE